MVTELWRLPGHCHPLGLPPSPVLGLFLPSVQPLLPGLAGTLTVSLSEGLPGARSPPQPRPLGLRPILTATRGRSLNVAGFAPELQGRTLSRRESPFLTWRAPSPTHSHSSPGEGPQAHVHPHTLTPARFILHTCSAAHACAHAQSARAWNRPLGLEDNGTASGSPGPPGAQGLRLPWSRFRACPVPSWQLGHKTDSFPQHPRGASERTTGPTGLGAGQEMMG